MSCFESPSSPHSRCFEGAYGLIWARTAESLRETDYEPSSRALGPRAQAGSIKLGSLWKGFATPSWFHHTYWGIRECSLWKNVGKEEIQKLNCTSELTIYQIVILTKLTSMPLKHRQRGAQRSAQPLWCTRLFGSNYLDLFCLVSPAFEPFPKPELYRKGHGKPQECDFIIL